MAKVPLSWEKGFDCGIVIPHKLRYCNKLTNDLMCENCDKLVNRTN